MFGISFHDRLECHFTTAKAITLNVERQVYREIQDLCRRERCTPSELIHNFFISKLESNNNTTTNN